MVKQKAIKQIHPKGNGQAVIYLSMLDLDEYNLKVGGFVELKERLDITYVKKRRNYKKPEEE